MILIKGVHMGVLFFFGGKSMTEKEWISKIAGDAQRAASEYGYLPSVLIAQTCQETGYGQTDLSQEGIYNTIGMKTELLNATWASKYWSGATYIKQTPEWYDGRRTTITDSFRVYKSYFDGLADYCQFMHDAKYSVGGAYKYRDLLGTKDPYTLIEGVRSRGYCTDPEYSKAIMRIIEKHNLTQYDGRKEVRGVTKPDIINRVAANRSQVPAHNANTHEYLAIHYLGVNGENPDLYGGGYGGHFYVSKVGQCYQAAEVTDKLWHVGASSGFSYKHPEARNANTIGIECACYSSGDRWYFTEATQEACAQLAAWIMSEYGIPMSNLLRHGDITTKHCPAPYIDNPGDGPNWTWDKFRKRAEEYLNGGKLKDGIYIRVGGNMIYRLDVIKKGSKGTSVLLLQEILKARGYYSGKLDRDFGDLTDAAFRAYQADRIASGAKIGGADGKPDGVVGSGSWNDLLALATA